VICYKEVLDLNLDKNDLLFLSYLANKYLEKTKSIQTHKGIFHPYKHFFIKEPSMDYSDNIIFNKIERCFNGYTTLSYIYERFHISRIPGVLPYHTDIRDCVLTIPLKKLKYPVIWIDENENVITSYDYRNPVLVNTKIRHGCLQNDEDRVLFQIGFYDSFDVVSSHIL